MVLKMMCVIFGRQVKRKPLLKAINRDKEASLNSVEGELKGKPV